MDCKLTILIPTYNRKERLVELLRSIEAQENFENYKLLICDNHSNYDVRECVESFFSEKFCKNVEYNVWNFNTGLSTNISSSFLLVKTEWCWMIGDDDIIEENSLKRIINDINQYRDVLAIKYSLTGFPPHEDRNITSLLDFAKYYRNENRRGEMMYLSMVYNIKNLYPYLTSLTEYSYTYLSFLLPILHGIADGQKMRLSSSVSIKYRIGANDNWATKGFMKVALGVRTLMDIDFNTDDKTLKELHKTFSGIMKAYQCLAPITTQYHSHYFRSVMWSSLRPLFRRSTPFPIYLCCNFIFYFFQITNINLEPFLRNIIKIFGYKR